VQAATINIEIGRLREKYPESDLCGDRGHLCLGRLLRGGCRRSDLRRQGEHCGSMCAQWTASVLTGTMEKLGVERRLLTAGENKGFLDPFSPLDPAQANTPGACLGRFTSQFVEVSARGAARPEGSAGHFFRLSVDGAEKYRSGPDRCLGALISFAREGHQGRENRRLHAARKSGRRRQAASVPRSRALCAARRAAFPRCAETFRLCQEQEYGWPAVPGSRGIFPLRTVRVVSCSVAR